MKRPTEIYLDNNATTPLDPRVLDAMRLALTAEFANPLSTHAAGRRAASLVDAARGDVAQLLGCSHREIVFTSGATESCNLALKGVAQACADRGNHIVTALTEHKAVLRTCARLERQSTEVTYLRPDPEGRITVEQVREALTDRTILVSIMTANNETGVLQPIEEIGDLCHRRGVLFHTDATQAVGRIPLDVKKARVDLLSLSAHKFHGPKGVGALYVRSVSPRVRLACQNDGGGQEGGLRSGTHNVPGIVGLGVAARLAFDAMEQEVARQAALRDRLEAGLHEGIEEVWVNGGGAPRLPNTLNVSFAGLSGEVLLNRLPRIAASTGSACASGGDDPHYVLRAMGVGEDRAAGAIRLSLGRFTTAEEVEEAIALIVATAKDLLALCRGTRRRSACCDTPGCCCPPPKKVEKRS
jgi:cysteine desulfurase